MSEGVFTKQDEIDAAYEPWIGNCRDPFLALQNRTSRNVQSSHRAKEAIQAMLAAKAAGNDATVIDAVPEPAALPAPRQAQRKRRKSDLGMGNVMGSDEDEGNS